MEYGKMSATNNGDAFAISCPLPNSDYPEIVLAHGGGGSLTRRLIEDVFVPAFSNPHLLEGHDGAVLDVGGARVAFTTDSYVVRPPFFPGGDIGALAVCGTINDLAMCGARPLHLSLGLIIEEGFPMADLQRVIDSIKRETERAGVTLVTGDTKVVDRGSGDGIYINTAGIGTVEPRASISPRSVRPGDAILLSGDIGRHGIAVMSAREQLELEFPIESDVAALDRPVRSLIQGGIEIDCLRDATRGGLATALVEIAVAAGVNIEIDETLIPVRDDVRGVCEILGLDPLYVACEGRFVAFVPADQRDRALELLRSDPVCRNACCIGVTSGSEENGLVTCTTEIGGTRVLDMLSGEQLPRIC